MERKALFMLLQNLLLTSLLGQAVSVLPMYGHPATAAVAGMADDVFGQVAHPGSVAKVRKSMAGFRFLRMAPEGAPVTMQAALSVPAGPGMISMQTWHAGMSSLRETSLTASYGTPISGGFSMGVGIGYSRLVIPLYVTIGRLQAEWGAVSHVAGGLWLSALLRAVPGVRSATPPRQWPLPLMVSFGIGYRLSEQASLSAELRKEEGRALVFTPVVYYQPVPELSVRAGIRSDDGSLSLSLCYRLGRFGIEAGGRQVGLLGWCGDVSIGWKQEAEGE